MFINRKIKINSDNLYILYMDNWDVQIHALIHLIPSRASRYSSLILKRYFDYRGFDDLKKNLFDENIKMSDIVREGGHSIQTCSFNSKFETQFDDLFILDVNENIIPSDRNKEDEDNKSKERQLLYDIISIGRKNVYLFSSDKPSIFLKELENKATKIIGSFDKPERWKGFDKPFGHPDSNYNPLVNWSDDDLPF